MQLEFTIFTFFLVQSEVGVGLLLHTVGETVKGEQVAFPVVPLKVERSVETGRKLLRDDHMIKDKNM